MSQLFDARGHDLRRSGVSVTLRGGNERVTMLGKGGVFLADEPALKDTISNKGHAGTTPGMLCMNAVLHTQPAGAEAFHTHSQYETSIVEVDWPMCKQHSDDSLRLAVAKLRSCTDSSYLAT